MILDSTLKIEAILSGAVATNQPDVHVNYVDWNQEGAVTPPQFFRVALNSANDVTILAAPLQANNTRREVLRIEIYNRDTASVTVTVKTDDSTTERPLIRVTLLTLEVLCWEKGHGWYALDTNGNRKEVTSSVFSSLTVTGLVDITASGAGQIKFPGTQNASSDANTLDDYEEGTFTPGFTINASATGITFSAQTGRYLKIGDGVWLWFAVTLSAKGASSGNVHVTAFPFTVANADHLSGGAILAYYATFTVATAPRLRLIQNTTTARFSDSAADSTSDLSEANINNTSSFIGSAFYRAT